MISSNHQSPGSMQQRIYSAKSTYLPTRLRLLSTDCFSIVLLLAILGSVWLSFFFRLRLFFCFWAFSAAFTSAFTFTFSRCYLLMSALRHCSAFFYEFHFYFFSPSKYGRRGGKNDTLLDTFLFFFSMVRVTGLRLLAGSLCGVR